MIARLSGTLVEKSTTHCVVDVGGVGYHVAIPLTTLYELPETGQPVLVHIHTHVREDVIALYGFHDPEERAVFQLMISVSGIGPKLAVNILSGITAADLIRAVTTDDLKRLTGIPGVGKKTAERMILDMKDKAARLGRKAAPAEAASLRPDEGMKEDALSALVNLGYKGAAVKEVLDRIIREAKEPPSLDQLLKQALKVIAG